MEAAIVAMERVPLTNSPHSELNDSYRDSEKASPTPHADIESVMDNPFIPDPPPVGEESFSLSRSNIFASMADDRPTGFFAPLVVNTHAFFDTFCHSMGTLCLRYLSAIMLLCGIAAAVALQMVAFYHTGVLNPWLLVACLLYAPTLVAAAFAREDFFLRSSLHHSGFFSLRMSYMVAMSFLVVLISTLCSVALPVVLYFDHRIDSRSMGVSITATAVFYYCLLLSEVLSATSVQLDRAKHLDDDERANVDRDPAWISQYRAIQTGRSNLY